MLQASQPFLSGSFFVPSISVGSLSLQDSAVVSSPSVALTGGATQPVLTSSDSYLSTSPLSRNTVPTSFAANNFIAPTLPSTKSARPSTTRNTSLLANILPGLTSVLLAGGALLLMPGCNSEHALIPEEEQHHVVVDYLQQPNPITDLDVLVVLDTSGSMSDNYTAVGNGMVNLQTDIDGWVDDTRFGFITTDPTNPDFHGPYDSSQALDIALAPGQLALQYTSSEAGFSTLYNYEQNLTDRSSFMRNEASLLVFFISDEEEQSGVGTDVWYSDYFSTLKDPGELDFVSITTLPTVDGQCITDSNGNLVSPNPAASSTGCKYIDLVETYYNKDAIDLTAPSWSAWLSTASFLTAKTYDIPLTQTPIIESMVAYRNHDELATSDWTYTEDDNLVTINFEPEWNDVIAVGYDVDDGG